MILYSKLLIKGLQVGGTALHFAADNGFYDLVAILLDHGADMNIANEVSDKC